MNVTTILITATGSDEIGDILRQVMITSGVRLKAHRLSGATGRIGVLLEPSGERTFVTDRGVVLQLATSQISEAWFTSAKALHLPAYSFVGPSLLNASLRAAEFARVQNALISVDLSSISLATDSSVEVLDIVEELRPDLLFANRDEAAIFLDTSKLTDLLKFVQLLIVKDGARGASVFRRDWKSQLTIPTSAAPTNDTTGAGFSPEASLKPFSVDLGVAHRQVWAAGSLSGASIQAGEGQRTAFEDRRITTFPNPMLASLFYSGSSRPGIRKRTSSPRGLRSIKEYAAVSSPSTDVLVTVFRTVAST